MYVLEYAIKICYKKFLKLLIDKGMMKRFSRTGEISIASIAKLGENVNTEILLKICIALRCDISDIMENVSGEE